MPASIPRPRQVAQIWHGPQRLTVTFGEGLRDREYVLRNAGGDVCLHLGPSAPSWNKDERVWYSHRGLTLVEKRARA